VANVNKVIIVGNLGRDPQIRYMPSGDGIASICADYRVRRDSASFKKKPAFAGSEAKQKAKDAGASTAIAGTTASGAADASDSGDDGGDSDGDSDGPRRRPHSRPSIPPFLSPLAPRRSNLATPLSRRAFAWLLTLALLLAYVGPPGFALLFVGLGQPGLAGEMLRYKPVLILPTPPGWTASGHSEEQADRSSNLTASAANVPTSPRTRSSKNATCASGVGSRVSDPARRPAGALDLRPGCRRRTTTSRMRVTSAAATSNPHGTCNGAPELAGGTNVSERVTQY